MKPIRTLALLAALATSPALADGIEADDAALMVGTWVGVVASGNADTVASVLAPEFQIVRGSGTQHDAASYVQNNFPKITSIPDATDFVVTGEGDIRVVSYVLQITETVDGKELQHEAPRLTVFRRIGETWFVSAHANFALPQG
ncbi:nuclear transport factor 2 family protein [Chachezhania antarctica]|uniref:nuclear transport factor 2 family protein n=1 Tax=Chachezhania antarctica TaxID=2340860 RepID=UPI000EAE6E6F|nr:nuclear transport factor 2 family protein [Chachezhania antarctica]|tara:strand:- start:848 stop:1279 length:432 start_codon:yes stop_codon:yes gene_type:complete